MNKPLTRRKTPAQRRAGNAARAARWREAHADRPDPRVVDRILLQALVHVLTEGDVLRPGAAEFLEEMVAAAVAGLRREGIYPREAKKAVGRRIGEHKSSQTVRQALSEAAMWQAVEDEKARTA